MTHETGLVIAILVGGTGGFLVMWLLQQESTFLKILSALFGAVAAGVVFIALSLFRMIFLFLGSEASPTGTLLFTVAMTMIAIGVAGIIRLFNWYRFR